MGDSKLMREDSYIMKTLAVAAIIFLPISTISSVFGTQFFTTVTADVSTDGPARPSTYVSSQFWILWTVAIPVTLILLLSWSFWVRRFQPKVQKPQRCAIDVEKGF